MKAVLIICILFFVLISSNVFSQMEFVFDFNSKPDINDQITNLIEYKNKVYFGATTSYSSIEKLWVHDGINEPTLFYDIEKNNLANGGTY